MKKRTVRPVSVNVATARSAMPYTPKSTQRIFAISFPSYLSAPFPKPCSAWERVRETLLAHPWITCPDRWTHS